MKEQILKGVVVGLQYGLGVVTGITVIRFGNSFSKAATRLSDKVLNNVVSDLNQKVTETKEEA